MRMKRHRFVVAIRGSLVWASALGLGAAYAPAAQAFDCTLPKHHCIKVTIDSATSTLNVDNKTLTKKAEPGHVMHWLIDNGSGQAYAFPARAIFVLPPLLLEKTIVAGSREFSGRASRLAASQAASTSQVRVCASATS